MCVYMERENVDMGPGLAVNSCQIHVIVLMTITKHKQLNVRILRYCGSEMQKQNDEENADNNQCYG